MSKPNKANKNNYSQAGRLTPDDMARERVKQGELSHSKGPPSRSRFGEAGENVIGKMRHSPDGPGASRPRTSREEPE